jgi:hypothetical protein
MYAYITYSDSSKNLVYVLNGLTCALPVEYATFQYYPLAGRQLELGQVKRLHLCDRGLQSSKRCFNLLTHCNWDVFTTSDHDSTSSRDVLECLVANSFIENICEHGEGCKTQCELRRSKSHICIALKRDQ